MRFNWRRALAPTVIVGGALLSPAYAQQQPQMPPPPQQAQPAPLCGRLEAQLQAFDRGSSDASRADQMRKFEESANNQQTEIDRQEAAARRAGCESNSFFVLFSGQQAQCGPINSKLQQMRANLERIQGDMEKVRSDPVPEREGQRRAILVALSQNNCGAQYQQQVATTPPPRGGLFESLFGAKTVMTPGAADAPPGMAPPSGTFRTVCVRTCDGYYYPISYAANASRFADDEKACRQSCPASDAQLYIYRNPGEDINQALSVNSQQPYTSLPNAFRYRTSFDKTCSCRQAGETWAQTLKNIDDTVEQGDIVVNEQRARQMSQPRVDAQGKPIRTDIRTPARPEQKAAPAPVPPVSAPAASAPPANDAAAAAEPPQKPDPNRTVRAVGPTFIPAR